MKEPYPQTSPPNKTHLVGGVGCFIYFILFFTAGMLVTNFGFNTLWVLAFMATYTLFWLGLVYLETLKHKRKIKEINNAKND